jgi:hypothetical protein
MVRCARLKPGRKKGDVTMPYTKEELRRPARITGFSVRDEDHCMDCVHVYLEGPTGGWGQGFGGLCLKDAAEARTFLREVCEVFGHQDPERLKGQECLALYSESPWATIEGIEGSAGQRFTIKGFRHRYYPDCAPTPTEAKTERLLNDIRYHQRRIREDRAELIALMREDGLVDWDAEP